MVWAILAGLSFARARAATACFGQRLWVRLNVCAAAYAGAIAPTAGLHPATQVSSGDQARCRPGIAEQGSAVAKISSKKWCPIFSVGRLARDSYFGGGGKTPYRFPSFWGTPSGSLVAPNFGHPQKECPIFGFKFWIPPPGGGRQKLDTISAPPRRRKLDTIPPPAGQILDSISGAWGARGVPVAEAASCTPGGFAGRRS